MSAEQLHIAFVTSEMVPFVKTGGLADFSAALPKALVRLGHRLTVVLPRYRSVPFPPGEFAGSVHVPVDNVPRSAGFYRTATTDGADVVFVEHPPFFDRPVPYGDYEDNRLRFAFLSRAALEYFRSRGERPDVFHAHDWQTGLLPVYLKSFYWDDPTLHRSPSVFTIHNVAYQGRRRHGGAAGPALEPRDQRRARVPRKRQLPEGRDPLLGAHQHGLAPIRAGDPEPGARPWVRGHPARAIRRARGHGGAVRPPHGPGGPASASITSTGPE